MARVAIKDEQVKWESETCKNLSDVLNKVGEKIRGLVASKKVSAKAINVTLDITPENEETKQYAGSAFLKMSEITGDDSARKETAGIILQELITAGPSAVIEAWNAFARDAVVSRLQREFGDKTQAIAEAIENLVKSGLMTEPEAREFVAKRQAALAEKARLEAAESTESEATA